MKALLFITLAAFLGSETPTPHIENYTSGPITPKISQAEVYARLVEEDQPWSEPTPLPGNRNR